MFESTVHVVGVAPGANVTFGPSSSRVTPRWPRRVCRYHSLNFPRFPTRREMTGARCVRNREGRHDQGHGRAALGWFVALCVVIGAVARWAARFVALARVRSGDAAHRCAVRSTGATVSGSDPAGIDRSYRGKRLADLALLAVVAVPASVLGAVCALAIRVLSGRPVFFRQERVGLHGRPFQVWKFRTMTVGDNPIYPDAAHITRVGALLRRLSLDELPQLLNVARGEMSIVGPRPTLAYQVERYDNVQRGRLSVRPGLTGLAQVSGRNRLAWSDRIEIDLDYVERNSLRLDLWILSRTLGPMLAGEGVGGHPTDDPLARIDANVDRGREVDDDV